MWCAVLQANQSIDVVAIVDAIYREAEARTGIKRETVAALQGISKGRISQQLHGDGHPSFRGLIGMWFHLDPDGQRFVKAVFQVASEHLGFSGRDPVAESIGQALMVLGDVVGRLKMARMDQPERAGEQERRRA